VAHFYLAEALVDAQPGSTVSLEGAEAKHAVAVSRVRAGETLSIGNGAGLIVMGPVVVAEPGHLSISVEDVTVHERPSPQITLVQALAKGGRDESAVQAATELGVDAVVPWASARSVVRWDSAKREKGRERWRAISREATKQSIRPYLPEVHGVETSAQVAARASTALVLILEPTAGTALSTVDLDDRDVVLVVGPEGGVSREELDLFEAAGCLPVRLGDGILRTSTAGPAAIAVLNARLGRW
jgi:16S rRNA (uracil1498-N3)-methyltransferase